jgi:hypothetical protein
MTALVILLVLTLIALAAPRWGADTHRSGEWGPGSLHDGWLPPDRWA